MAIAHKNLDANSHLLPLMELAPSFSQKPQVQGNSKNSEESLLSEIRASSEMEQTFSQDLSSRSIIYMDVLDFSTLYIPSVLTARQLPSTSESSSTSQAIVPFLPSYAHSDIDTGIHTTWKSNIRIFDIVI